MIVVPFNQPRSSWSGQSAFREQSVLMWLPSPSESGSWDLSWLQMLSFLLATVAQKERQQKRRESIRDQQRWMSFWDFTNQRRWNYSKDLRVGLFVWEGLGRKREKRERECSLNSKCTSISIGTTLRQWSQYTYNYQINTGVRILPGILIIIKQTLEVAYQLNSLMITWGGLRYRRHRWLPRAQNARGAPQMRFFRKWSLSWWLLTCVTLLLFCWAIANQNSPLLCVASLLCVCYATPSEESSKDSPEGFQSDRMPNQSNLQFAVLGSGKV